ncbi:tRNA uridine-5-carboxymethylaminomethyl(34) synthesis GTPase MnmE [Anaplasma bovis]|uniref:tRNA uridine-5-carboxymethylaminomethyl(34) synthesis GTPase MnmE n=1 Tax=Anaplasma bovis TaxID=186733 RepID=UPI002FF033D6
MPKADTIFALSTPRGKSGVAVIRISGPASLDAIRNMGVKGEIEPRMAHCKTLYDRKGIPIDYAVILYFPGPNSFTGEDVVELQVHGSNAVIRLIFEELQGFIRIAEPGEFSLRAFLNGKIDLTRAEGIADLINAETEAQLRQALAQTSGKLEALYKNWRNAVISVISRLEACIDFPEDISSDVLLGIHHEIEELHKMLKEHINDENRGERLKNGARVVILGAPNAGKSTLFNFIAQREIAITSEYPGTTRDMLEVCVDIGGYPFIFVDTAGIRESSDFVECEGIKRAKLAAQEADIKVVMVPYGEIESFDFNILEKLHDENTIYVLSKADDAKYDILEIKGKSFCLLSVHNNLGVNNLLAQISEKSKESFPKHGDVLITSQRHRGHVQNAIKNILEINEEMPVEIIAEYLRLAAKELGAITGAVHVDDILSSIFGKFCVGK